MDFSMEKIDVGGIPVLQLTGTLMDADVMRFSREVRRITQASSSGIGIDVSGLEFMDSHALGLLVFHHSSLREFNRSLVVISSNPNPRAYITGLFETTGLNKVLIIVNKKEDVAGATRSS